MPSAFKKTRKAISKKRNGVIDALHEKSRDARRLNRAHIRDERIDKIASARRKRDQPHMERVQFFQEAVEESGRKPFDLPKVHAKVHEFVHRFDEEYDEVKKARRAGRPPSAKEDLLRMKIADLAKEYQTGFLLPDLTTEENVTKLVLWEGSWPYLSTMSWVRLPEAGEARPSAFPPKGDH